MSDEENQDKPKIQSDNGSISLGFDNSGNIQAGAINITNTIYNNAAAEQQKSPDLNETIETEYFELETILIPDGSFWMGSDTGEDNEKPRHEVNLRVYRISKYPVTNTQYAEFISKSEKNIKMPSNWSDLKGPVGLEDKPVMGVTLEDARGYCKWLSGITKRKYDLPNEAQLEMAYQGPYGCDDIVENIYLWTCTLWGEKGSSPDSKYRYPWKKGEYEWRNNPNANSGIRRVVCRYQKLDDASGSKRHSRRGELPGDPGVSGSRRSFRVVMNV